MLYALLVIIWFFCGVNILCRTGISRLFYFYVGILLVPSAIDIIPIAILTGHAFYASMFIFSMFLHGEFNLRTFTQPPVKYSLFFVLVACLLIGLFDGRVGPVRGVIRGMTVFITSYFLFYVGWLSIKNKQISGYAMGFSQSDDRSLFIRKLLPVTLIVTVFGLFTALFQHNPVLDAIELDRFFNEEMAQEGNYRAFRVTSFCVSSSVYGISCAILFLSSFALVKNRSVIQTISIIMLALNVVLSATRAAIIPFIFGLCLFFLLNKKNKIVKYLILTGIIIIFLVPFLSVISPSVLNYFSQMAESILDVVSPKGSGGAEFGGSSIDARTMQIAGAFEYLKEKPLFGHGFSYFSEVISKGEKDDTLLGMESYLTFIGIEYGLVYFIAILFFYVSSLIYFIRSRRINKLYADLGIAIICMFILYLIFAWVGGCWFFVMPIIGYIMKVIYLDYRIPNYKD